MIYEFHPLCIVRYILYMKQLDLAMAQCISPRSSAHMILKMVVHGHMLWKMGVSQPTFFKWSLTSRELLLSQATNHWFLASQWQQGRENVNCSIQILLEAVEILVSVSNISSMKTGSSLHHFSKTCFHCGKSMLLSSFLKLSIALVSSHQSLIPCFAVAAEKRTC